MFTSFFLLLFENLKNECIGLCLFLYLHVVYKLTHSHTHKGIFLFLSLLFWICSVFARVAIEFPFRKYSAEYVDSERFYLFHKKLFLSQNSACLRIAETEMKRMERNSEQNYKISSVLFFYKMVRTGIRAFLPSAAWF